jgi:L-iditol 2-dehydrogenase
VLITEEVLQAQCLRPIPDPALPYAHAALCEPLSCVISAQDHHVHLLQEDGTSPRRAAKGLKPDSLVLIIGAGAMGRMHVDLALSSRPRSIVVADVSGQRLKLVSQHFAQRAADLNVPLHTVNPSEKALAEVIEQLSDGRGADDVIVAAASKQAIESAQYLVARGGVLNLFAGLKAGADVVALSTGVAHYREAIVTGSSGGSPWDIDMTLRLMTNGSLDPSSHIAQVGDLEHAIGFLNLVKSNEIEGKAMVYPHRRASQPRSVAVWTAKDEQEYLEPLGGPQPSRATS